MGYDLKLVEESLKLKVANEIFVQFFIGIYKEIPNCILASFGKFKNVNTMG